MIRKIALSAILIFAGMFIFVSSSHALDISIGASTWYAKWETDQSGESHETDIDPAFLYGPVLGINFTPTVSLTSVFLYGEFDMGDDDDDGDSNEIERYDSDTALNFALSRYVKLFGGLKYMGYDWESGEHIGYGPALGIALTVPLFDNFYLLINASGMYLWGTHEEKDDDSGEKIEEDYNEPGFNTNLSIAYYIAPASLSIILGGRYQYFKTEQDNDEGGDMEHTFYGVTLTAVYSFSI